MEKLIKIAGQQFYYSTIEEVVGQENQIKKCAIILDEPDLGTLLGKTSVINTGANQLIIIGDSLNTSFESLKDENVLLLSASNFEEAIRLAILSVELNSNIVCTSKGNKEKVEGVIEELMV